MGEFPNLFQELEQKSKISKNELERIRFEMKHLRSQRRNRDAHCYFKYINFMETIYGKNDLKDIYIPLLNKLIEVYNR